MSVLSVGLAFCDIPLRPCPPNIMELDNYQIHKVEMHSGGDALNVAVVLAKMGAEVELNAKVGNDAGGKFLLSELEKDGVCADAVTVEEDYATATCYQLIEENGQRHFLVDSEINKLLKNIDITDEQIQKADIVFMGSALAMEGMNDQEISRLFQRAHEKGKITAMDASVAVPDSESCKMNLLRQTLQHTDIFIPSYEEASYLAQKEKVEDIIEAFRQFPLKVFGIKLGAEGCVLTDFRETIYRKPYKGKPVVDTTGAGDCFMGGFLYAYSQGKTMEECGKFGSAVSAFGISAIGPSTAVPDYETVLQFIKDSEEGTDNGIQTKI